MRSPTPRESLGMTLVGMAIGRLLVAAAQRFDAAVARAVTLPAPEPVAGRLDIDWRAALASGEVSVESIQRWRRRYGAHTPGLN